MHPVIAFDMNGTLLDTAALDPLFDAIFRAASIRHEWFTQLIQLSMVSTITGHYTDFNNLGRAALGMTAERHGVPISEELRTRILNTMRQLPPFPDVEPSLKNLRAAGFRLAVLTNSPLSSAEESLSHANLRGFFEQVMSVEMVQRYKPAAEVYRAATARLNISPSQMMLVAAHSWDTTGALRAGCRAAFLARPGQVLDPLAPKPELIVRDLHGLIGSLSREQAA